MFPCSRAVYKRESGRASSTVTSSITSASMINHRSGDPHFGHTLLTRQSEQRGERSFRALRLRHNRGERAVFGRTQVNEISRFSDLKITDLAGEAERLGAGTSGQIQK